MDRPPVRPNFFIVGAPKCGTTSLASWLSGHPECYFSSRKELHYLCPDIDYHFRIRSEQEYLGFFENTCHEKVIGEGSVWYLYSRVAARKIYQFSPESKIIIMLRHPVELLPSLHSQYVRNGYEQIEDFSEALAAHSRRILGQDRPLRQLMNPLFAPAGLVYWEACYFVDQVKRFLECNRANHVLILSFKDFRENSLKVFGDVCRFLEIDDSFVPGLQIFNARERREPVNQETAALIQSRYEHELSRLYSLTGISLV